MQLMTNTIYKPNNYKASGYKKNSYKTKILCIIVVLVLGLSESFAVDTYNLEDFRSRLRKNKKLNTQNNIRLGSVTINLRDRHINGDERITNSDTEFSLGIDLFRSIVQLYFNFIQLTPAERCQSPEQQYQLQQPLMRNALELITHIFSLNADSTNESNRLSRSNASKKFFRSTFEETTCSASTTARGGLPNIDYRGYFTYNANDIRSGNSPDNGVALVIMAFLSPWMMILSQEDSMSLTTFHQYFDLIQDAFNRKSNLRRLRNKGKGKIKKQPLEADPDIFPYYAAEDIGRMIINHGQAPEIILLAYLRALSLAISDRLTNSNSPELNLNNVFGRFITADLLKIIVHNQFFCHIMLGRPVIDPNTQLGNVQECQSLTRNNGSFPSNTFIAAITMILDRMQEWDRHGILNVINLILGTHIIPDQAVEDPHTNRDQESQRNAIASAPEPEGVTINMECKICLEPPTNPVIVLDCGHLAFCENCINLHRRINSETCPICRTIIKDTKRFFPQ